MFGIFRNYGEKENIPVLKVHFRHLFLYDIEIVKRETPDRMNRM